jgi:hypothetical protein
MTTPEPVATAALSRARRAYERAQVLAGLRGVVAAAVLCAVAFALHDLTPTAQLVAGALAITLGVLGWRGGAWRRGSFAGVLAGLPPLVAPWLVFALTHHGRIEHCPACDGAPTLGCLVTCFATSTAVGILVGLRAVRVRRRRARRRRVHRRARVRVDGARRRGRRDRRARDRRRDRLGAGAAHGVAAAHIRRWPRSCNSRSR